MVEHTIELLPENWAIANDRQNTERKGTNWADKVNPGDHLLFVDGERKQIAWVTRVTKARSEDLTGAECGANHAYNSREKLASALCRAYGSIAFDDIVSLLEFHCPR
jgi:hypothetical protein